MSRASLVVSFFVSCMLMTAVLTRAQDAPKPVLALCEAGPPLGKSNSGVVQVSNLEMISVTCRIPAKRLPKSGVQHGLRVDPKTYMLSTDGIRRLIPSNFNCCGGGGNVNFERVSFDLEIPIDASERDAAIKAYYSEWARSAASSSDPREREKAKLVQKIAPQALVPYFRQHQLGRFQVDCSVLDEGRVLAVGHADLEVVFKGNFFDQPQFHSK